MPQAAAFHHHPHAARPHFPVRQTGFYPRLLCTHKYEKHENPSLRRAKDRWTKKIKITILSLVADEIHGLHQ
jgi:hypothetical protein